MRDVYNRAIMKSLLLVIDMQKGWRNRTATEAVMLRTARLCKSFEGDIIHCCFKNDKDSLFYTQLNWEHFFDPHETDIIPEIEPLNLPIYWRSTYNCINDETLPIVKQYDEVFIAGVFTDISVSATAMSIFDHNIPVRVVQDCVATLHGQAVHESALISLDFAIGKHNLVRAATLMSPDK